MKKKCAEGEQIADLQYTKITRSCVIPDLRKGSTTPAGVSC
ncbi:MAG: hypothetical protein SNG49_02815 [Rikenellaceae bacterium]